MSTEPVLQIEDLAVFAVVLNLLTERDPLEIRADHGGTWPKWADLPPTPELLGRIAHLAENGWLSLSSEGSGSRSVTYGPAALRVAREAGVPIPTE